MYEQLYDTLDSVGGPEVRAQATAKVSTVPLWFVTEDDDINSNTGITLYLIMSVN